MGSDTHYDLIVVGTSFAGTFFLHKYLERFAQRQPRILVLERGSNQTLEWRLETGKAGDVPESETFANRTPERKHWSAHVTFGGNSNVWWACAPRFMPNDFRMQTLYGVGTDWPISYEQLDPYYEQAEELMSVSGGSPTPYPRRKPYPLPPHLLGEAEEALARAYPGEFIPLPSARWSLPLTNPARAQCCASGVCTFCPIDAKFTILNSMADLYRRPGVELRLGCPALAVETRGNMATGVTWLDQAGGTRHTSRADIVVLGANPIINAFLLMRSGLAHPRLGKRLCDQRSTFVSVKLAGLTSFGGSTSLTSHGYMLYDGAFRSEHAGFLLEIDNMPRFRVEQNRWREVLHFKAIAEVLPSESSYVGMDSSDPANGPNLPGRPYTHYEQDGDYTERAFAALPALLERALAPLPVEAIEIQGRSLGEGHMAGTTMMGNDPASSVVDRNLAWHGIPNLVLPGSGVFPTMPPANPTLTLAALALWAADRI
ncbi:MAG: GMC family oxidoreductase [Planctomycetes bacterium]|nr:GMC family oxidoreductase [Planctomycetota bacterium]